MFYWHYAWIKKNFGQGKYSYDELDHFAETVPIGSKSLSIIPFGNGAERLLNNKEIGCSLEGLNFNVHTFSHLIRAAQEGMVFAFNEGVGIMNEMGLSVDTIHAGNANMFLSKIFRETLASITGATIKLYDTDGAAGAAKGAGIGASIYKDADEAFSTLKLISETHPDVVNRNQYVEAYELWKSRLNKHMTSF